MMTRADEIADEFRAPPSARVQLRRNGAVMAQSATAPPASTPAPEPAADHVHHGHLHVPHLGHAQTELPTEQESPADPVTDTPSGPTGEPQSAVSEIGEESDEVASTDANTEPTAEDVAADEVEIQPEPPRAHTNQPVHAPQHESLPSIARAAAGGLLQAAGWTAGTSLRVSGQLRRLAVDPSSAQEVIDEVAREVREVARDFLGITELEEEVREIAPLLSSGLLKAGGASPEALRAQGEALLRAAADVGFDESAHPAFARILTELSPDEARILRLLALEGPQPMVDVRASNLIGNGSQLIAQALNMLGPKAGLRQRDRVPVYLTNLTRLSLVNLSEDPLESPVQYQVLEAQPEVIATLRDTIRAKTIRRSITLTPLGQEFCEVCLPVSLPALPPPRNP